MCLAEWCPHLLDTFMHFNYRMNPSFELELANLMMITIKCAWLLKFPIHFQIFKRDKEKYAFFLTKNKNQQQSSQIQFWWITFKKNMLQMDVKSLQLTQRYEHSFCQVGSANIANGIHCKNHVNQRNHW